MKVGLYFGSFNPVHVGHLIIAGYIADVKNLDQVWFVVSPQNPFKKSATLLNEYHRLHLVNLAIDGDLRLRASNIEFKLPKPSYTIDTLIYLKEKYPVHEFSLIIGSDSYQNISKWKNYELLISNYKWLVYERPRFPVSDILLPNFDVVKAPLLDISATFIRNLIVNNRSIKYFVPETVRTEIENNHYYKED